MSHTRQDRTQYTLPLLSNKKASLVLNAVEGFGPRRLILSARARKNLTIVHKKPRLNSEVLQMLRYGTVDCLRYHSVSVMTLIYSVCCRERARNHKTSNAWPPVSKRPSLRQGSGPIALLSYVRLLTGAALCSLLSSTATHRCRLMSTR